MKHAKIGSIEGVHCAGCRYSFESYGVLASEGYTQGGKTYCCSDCQMEAEVASIEAGEWESLSEEY